MLSDPQKKITMSSRPKRDRKVPERYGFNSNADQDESESEDILVKQEDTQQKVAAPKPRGKRVKKEEPEYNSVGVEIKAEVSIPVESRAASGPLPKRPNSGSTITLTTAKTEYKLTDSELAQLDCDVRRNPHDPRFAPMRLYNHLEVYELAIQKFGSPEGLLEAREKSKQRGDKMKAARQANAHLKQEAESRQRDVAQLLRQYGIPQKYLQSQKELQNYVKKNEGDLDVILARVAEVAAEAEMQENARKDYLKER